MSQYTISPARNRLVCTLSVLYNEDNKTMFFTFSGVR